MYVCEDTGLAVVCVAQDVICITLPPFLFDSQPYPVVCPSQLYPQFQKADHYIYSQSLQVKAMCLYFAPVQKPHPLVSSRFQQYIKTKNGMCEVYHSCLHSQLCVYRPGSHSPCQRVLEFLRLGLYMFCV